MAASRTGSQATKPLILSNGFTQPESDYLHASISKSGMRWFDGEGCILAKHDEAELVFRPGQSEHHRWVVLAFPVMDMNLEGSLEAALHFLSEAYHMAHQVELQFQPAINMQTEQLEFLMQLPLQGVQSGQLGEMIKHFVDSLVLGIDAELSRILGQPR